MIAADTTVDLGGEILGKPVDDADAASMLRRPVGRAPIECTPASPCASAIRRSPRSCTTLVTFVTLDEATIAWYVATGEPMDKAGAYALQGAGGALVRHVSGSVSNVIGLPLHVVIDLAGRCGVDLLTAAR